jgi:arginase
MPAVDSPAPGGAGPSQLTAMIAVLAPGAAGADVTVFDPDLDPDGRHTRLLAGLLAEGLKALGAAPDSAPQGRLNLSPPVSWVRGRRRP